MKKNIILGSIIGFLVIVIAVLSAALVIRNVDKDNNDDDNNDKNKTKISSEYKPLAEEFAEAIKDKDKMEEFIENYIDFKAVYAMEKVYELEEATDKEKKETFDECYENPDKYEYKRNKDMWYNSYISDVNPSIELKLKDIKEYTFKDFMENPCIEVTYKFEGEDVTISFEMYEDRIIYIYWPEKLTEMFETSEYVDPFSWKEYNKMEISDDFSCMKTSGFSLKYRYECDDYNPQITHTSAGNEITLNNGVVINTIENYMSYSEEIDFKYLANDDTESFEDVIGEIAEIFGVFIYYEFEDTEEIKDKVVDLLVEVQEQLYYDDELPFPQDMYDEYVIIDHIRYRVKAIAVSENQTEFHLILTPDKKASK